LPGIEGYGLSVAVLTIAIMITIGGFAVGLGFASNNKKLKEFGIEEIFQSLINGVLVGSFAVLFVQNGLITSTVNAITLSNTSSLSCSSYLSQNYAICFSYDYLVGPGYTFNGAYHQSLLDQSTELTIGFLGLNTVLGIIAGLNLNAAVISISFSSALNPIINQIQYFIKILTTISISALVQSSLLEVVAGSAITLILPTGLILRTFYPTRKIGGFLIAVAIGMYVILPMSYVLNANILDSYSTSVSNSTIVELSGSAGGIEGQILSISGTPKTSLISSIAGAVGGIGSAFSTIANAAISDVSYFILAAFILPAFSLVLTTISIKELSSILGSEVSFGMFDMV
jgi:hypothetical protein